ncbi:MAG TPA: molybdopterin-binding protein [Patescibacteria group bacterium]|nr:molybdopterin-binding protein [Patescibacteria group bacterium]
MKSVSVYQAEGMVLCHDITEIVPGVKKGRAFKKGHVIRGDDVEKFLMLGKEHVFVWEISEGTLHENDAAVRLARAMSGPGVELAEAAEGKVEVRAAQDGWLQIDVSALEEVNEVEQIAVATLHSHQWVKKGQLLAGCKIIPLVIAEEKLRNVEAICADHSAVISVKSLPAKRVGIVTTGGEVYSGRIQDAFGPVMKEKFSRLGSTLLRQVLVPDDATQIAAAILQLKDAGAELIVTTGGMSVDPDDVTPAGIREAGGRIVSYGAPTLPGAMFMLAYLDDVPVLGLPGCVMFHKSTVFDLVTPRILAGEILTRRDIIRLGHGGLCQLCPECHYPDCGFGRG